MARASCPLLREVRRGLAVPFTDPIRIPVTILTRAEARAIERMLLGSSSADAGRKDNRGEPKA